VEKMEADELFDTHLDGTIYRDKQVEERGVHLTVGSVHEVLKRGETDFGGDEEVPCETEKMTPLKRSPDDDYGWWDLDRGHYRVRFNETIRSESGAYLLVPNERILACGCTLAPTVVREGIIDTVLVVPGQGVSIKENARIGLLCPLR
jgi:hypothetical protein